ncbi:hypothetical protein GCM10009836_61540 [Pseudonocardia ailaonensis]|uniref:Uncharacterized protein n=1 Tax=Pseudonocardia ailaonensis TaxID=367279 RepID=A0ABN2NJS0_9PSEU
MSDVATMIESAYRNVATASDPVGGRQAAAEIAKTLASWHVSEIIAASTAAEVLRGALTSALAARSEPSTDSVFPVALFDINFASGTEFARAAALARSRGATAVYGIALYQLGRSGPTAAECGLDALHIVNPWMNADDDREAAERSITSSGLTA